MKPLTSHKCLSLWFAVCLISASACDSQLETGAQPPPDAAVKPDASGAQQVEPVPGVPNFRCDDGQTFELKLPCRLGNASLFALECEAVGAVTQPALGTHGAGQSVGLVDMYHLVETLGKILPLEEVLPVAPAVNMQIKRNNVGFRLMRFSGEAQFLQVDLPKRSFLGRFVDAGFIFVSDGGESITCHNADGLFWAVPGNFL